MLPKRYRFFNFDFKKFAHSQRWNGQVCAVRFLPNQLNHSRFAVTIDKRLSVSAVKRNRSRRRVYEFIRLRLQCFKPGDYLIKVHQDITTLSPAELEKILTHDLLRAVNR